MAAAANQRRTYQRSFSKQMMNVTRYSVSGTIHSSGTTATFWQTWQVIDISSEEASAGRAIQQATVDHCRAIPASRSAAGEDFARGLRRQPQPAQPQGDDAAQHDVGPEGQRPNQPLPLRGQRGLDQERIADQSEQGAEIRQRVQTVGRAIAVDPRKPRLHQWRSGRQQKVRQADVPRQQQQDPPDGVFPVRRPPGFDRGDRQQQQRQSGQRQMHEILPRHPLHVNQAMGVGISRQQNRLKKQQTGRPHGGAAAKPRQNHLAEQGLDLKQQERPQQDRRGKPARKASGGSVLHGRLLASLATAYAVNWY